MIDFDEIDDWEPKLSLALNPHVSDSVCQWLIEANPRFVEDAGDLLLSHTDRDAVVNATLDWLSSETIAGFHGSRLTDSDINSIRAQGLIPLLAGARRDRLQRALSSHPRWAEVQDRLDATIHSLGSQCKAGSREGQVHLTLSRAGLTSHFNHYLKFGSEFDYHAAHDLLGHEGKDFLARDGTPQVIRVSIPGPLALIAANPYLSVEQLQSRGRIPNLASEFLEARSYRVAHPGYQSRTLKLDCGLIFYEAVPPHWIAGFADWKP